MLYRQEQDFQESLQKSFAEFSQKPEAIFKAESVSGQEDQKLHKIKTKRKKIIISGHHQRILEHNSLKNLRKGHHVSLERTRIATPEPRRNSLKHRQRDNLERFLKPNVEKLR